MTLLSPVLLQKLGRARLQTRRAVASTGIGERPSRAKGAGIEFEDYRPYQPGDNVRHLDRNVFMRSGQHYVKQFVAYRQLPVTILLDASSSMGYGVPQKFAFAKSLVAGLAYVGLAGGDQVLVGAFGKGMEWHTRMQGARHLTSLHNWLEPLKPGGAMSATRMARKALPRFLSEGLTILISDWMADGIEEALLALRGANQEVVGIHLLSPEEVEPERLGAGEIRFIDSETQQELEASVDEALYKRYHQELEAWTLELQQRLYAQHGRYFRVRSDNDLERLFLRTWRQEGLIS